MTCRVGAHATAMPRPSLPSTDGYLPRSKSEKSACVSRNFGPYRQCVTFFSRGNIGRFIAWELKLLAAGLTTLHGQ